MSESEDLTVPYDRPKPVSQGVLVGRVLAGHRVLGVLGKGGMGEVYLAEDIHLKRRVALKVLPAELTADAERLARFRREAEALAKLDHPGIVRVYGFHAVDDLCIFTMELVEGGTLGERIGKGLLGGGPTLEEFFALALQLIDAIHAAHERGVVHRDLKPQNIMVTPDGRVRVLDFGLVKLRSSSSISHGTRDVEEIDTSPFAANTRSEETTQVESLTRAGAIFGTLAYMAPEQIDGRPIDRRTDVYALGVILFEMLTGRRPFENRSVMRMFYAILNQAPHLPESDLISDTLRGIVLRSLEKSPATRFPTAAALGEALARLRERIRTAHSHRRRLRIVAGATAVLVAVLLALTGWALHNAQRAEEEARRARDLALVALAGDVDPTTGASLLVEVSRPAQTPGAAQRMLDLSQASIAREELRHEQAIHELVFSRDGRLLATASADHTARVWNLADPQHPVVLAGHQDIVWSVAIDNAGTRALTASLDGTARLWDLADPSDPVVFRGHEAPVSAARFSPDEERVLTASFDGTARLWSLADARAPTIFRGHESRIWSACFSPDGSSIVTASGDGTARVWNPEELQSVAVLRHEKEVYSAVFSPDGARVLTASWDGTARVWDLKKPGDPVILRGHEDALWSARFSPDGTRVITASWDRTARLWTLEDPSRPLIFPHEGGVITALFSPDGRYVVTAAEDQTSRVWDPDDLEHPRILQGPVRTALFSPDGGLVVTGGPTGTVRIWTLPSANSSGALRYVENPLVFQDPEHPIVAAALSPDGTRVVTGSGDGSVAIRSVQDPFKIAPLQTLLGHQRRVSRVAFSPNARRVAAGAEDHTVRVWDLEDPLNALVFRGHEADIETVEFSPDGERLLTASEDRSARIWDARNPDRFQILKHEDQVFSATFNREGTQVATTSFDGTTRIWRLGDPEREPEILQFFESSGGPAFSAMFSPEGERLITGSLDGAARMWNLAEPEEEPLLLEGHGSGVIGVAISPAGTHVVTGSWDRTAWVWDLTNLENPLILQGHEDRLTSVAFSSDGSRILTTSLDGTARLWIYRLEDLREYLHSSSHVCLTESARRLRLGETSEVSSRRAESCRVEAAKRRLLQ